MASSVLARVTVPAGAADDREGQVVGYPRSVRAEVLRHAAPARILADRASPEARYEAAWTGALDRLDPASYLHRTRHPRLGRAVRVRAGPAGQLAATSLSQVRTQVR